MTENCGEEVVGKEAAMPKQAEGTVSKPAAMSEQDTDTLGKHSAVSGKDAVEKEAPEDRGKNAATVPGTESAGENANMTENQRAEKNIATTEDWEHHSADRNIATPEAYGTANKILRPHVADDQSSLGGNEEEDQSSLGGNEEEDQSAPPPSPTNSRVLRMLWDFSVLPFTTTWSSLHFFHIDETPWHRLQQDTARCQPPVSSSPASDTTISPILVSPEDQDRVEAQSGPPLVITNLKAKTSWSRGTTMNCATFILATTVVVLIMCGVGCTYYSLKHRGETRSGLDPLSTSQLHASSGTHSALTQRTPVCIAPEQLTTDDLLTHLFKALESTATANQSAPDTTRLLQIIAWAKLSLSRPPSMSRPFHTAVSTWSSFHQAVIRVEQAKRLLRIDQAILLGVNFPANTTGEDFMDNIDQDFTSEDSNSKGFISDNTLLHIGDGKKILGPDNSEHAKAQQAVASNLHVRGWTCLRLSLESTRRLRTEVLGIHPMGVSDT